MEWGRGLPCKWHTRLLCYESLWQLPFLSSPEKQSLGCRHKATGLQVSPSLASATRTCPAPAPSSTPLHYCSPAMHPANLPQTCQGKGAQLQWSAVNAFIKTTPLVDKHFSVNFQASHCPAGNGGVASPPPAVEHTGPSAPSHERKADRLCPEPAASSSTSWNVHGTVQSQVSVSLLSVQ